MNRHAAQTSNKKSQPATKNEHQELLNDTASFQFKNNRPQAVAQRKLQDLANNSAQVNQLKGIHKTNNHVNSHTDSAHFFAFSQPQANSTHQVLQRAVIEVPSSGHENLHSLVEESMDLKRGAESIRTRDDVGVAERGELTDIPNGESIYFVGHGRAGVIGSFTAKSMLQGLQEMKLPLAYTGTIILAACDSGVRTMWGIGPSLAGELAGLLSAGGYHARVVGLTGKMIVMDGGEIRIVENNTAYDAALADWRIQNNTYKTDKAAFEKDGEVSGFTEEVLNERRDALAAERDYIMRENSVNYALGGKVIRGQSDDHYMAAGGVAIGLVASIAAGIFKYMKK